MPPKKKALAGKFVTQDAEKPSWAKKKGTKGKIEVAPVEEPQPALEPEEVIVEAAVPDIPAAEQSQVIEDKENKKPAQVKKKKALAGHFVGEDGSFSSKKGKKQKEPAAPTAQVEVPEPAKEPEIVKEPEVAEITDEKKKPAQVKKKKALAGHFVGEDGSFASKKGKKQKEPA